jgi:hypothetical protein
MTGDGNELDKRVVKMNTDMIMIAIAFPDAFMVALLVFVSCLSILAITDVLLTCLRFCDRFKQF